MISEVPSWLNGPNNLKFYTHMIRESHRDATIKSLERALRRFDGSDEAAFIERHFRSVCTVSNFDEWISLLSVKNNRQFCPIVHDIVASRYDRTEGSALARQLAVMIGQTGRKPAIEALIKSGKNRPEFTESLSLMALNVPDQSERSRWKLELRARQFELVKEYDIASRIYAKIAERDMALREFNRRKRTENKISNRATRRRLPDDYGQESSLEDRSIESANPEPRDSSSARKRFEADKNTNVLPPAAMIVVPESFLVDFSASMSKAQMCIESADTLYLASALSRHDRWRLSLAKEVEIACGADLIRISAMSVDSGAEFLTIGIYGPDLQLPEIVKLTAETVFSPSAGTIEAATVGAIVYLFGSPERLRVSHAAGDEDTISKCWGPVSSNSATYRPNAGFDWGQLNRVVKLTSLSPGTTARDPHDVRGYIQHRRGKPVRVRPHRKGGRI